MGDFAKSKRQIMREGWWERDREGGRKKGKGERELH